MMSMHLLSESLISALVAVKDLLQYISCCDRVLLSRVIVGFFLKTRSGDLVSSSPNLGRQASILRLGASFLMACTRKKEKHSFANTSNEM